MKEKTLTKLDYLIETLKDKYKDNAWKDEEMGRMIIKYHADDMDLQLNDNHITSLIKLLKIK